MNYKGLSHESYEAAHHRSFVSNRKALNPRAPFTDSCMGQFVSLSRLRDEILKKKEKSRSMELLEENAVSYCSQSSRTVAE